MIPEWRPERIAPAIAVSFGCVHLRSEETEKKRIGAAYLEHIFYLYNVSVP